MWTVDREHKVVVDILPQIASGSSSRHRSDERDDGATRDKNPFPTHGSAIGIPGGPLSETEVRNPKSDPSVFGSEASAEWFGLR
jgi:hypothetical protein